MTLLTRPTPISFSSVNPRYSHQIYPTACPYSGENIVLNSILKTSMIQKLPSLITSLMVELWWCGRSPWTCMYLFFLYQVQLSSHSSTNLLASQFLFILHFIYQPQERILISLNKSLSWATVFMISMKNMETAWYSLGVMAMSTGTILAGWSCSISF